MEPGTAMTFLPASAASLTSDKVRERIPASITTKCSTAAINNLRHPNQI